MRPFWLGGMALLLAACGGGLPSLNVTLVDGVGEPLLPLAAAWRVGPPPSTSGMPWNALPTSQFSWSLSLPPGARFQLAFRCPNAGSTQFYLSLDLNRSELGNHLLVRCPSVYASPTVTVGGSVSPSLQNGTAVSSRGQAVMSGTTFSGLLLAQGAGREVAVLGVDSGGTPHFGRTGPLTVGPGTTTVGPLGLAPTSMLTTTTPAGFFSDASLLLGTFVQVPLASWAGGAQAVPRPGLGNGDLFQFWTCHGTSCALWRLDQGDPAVAPGAFLTLNIPPLTFSANQTHTSTSLPSFANLSFSGFSPGLTPMGYAFFLGEPSIRYWRHYLSPGALGNATTYYLDVENAPGFNGVVPTPGSSVQLRTTAFAGDQPLGALLAARPLPQETFTGHTLFLDRSWRVRFEVALLQTNFTW